MAFLNNEGQFTDESLSLLMRDLKGFITATKHYRVAISEPALRDPDQILESEYVKSEELCKGCSDNRTNDKCDRCNKNDICWHKARKRAEELLESLNKLV